MQPASTADAFVGDEDLGPFDQGLWESLRDGVEGPEVQADKPDKVKDWFNYGEQIWACFTGTTQHAPELADHLKARRLTMAAFLRDLLKKVYNVRIRGGDVEDFHLERDYEELRRMMTRRERGEGAEDEQGEVGLNKV